MDIIGQCAYCRENFIRQNAEQKYCKRTHATKAASKERKARRDERVNCSYCTKPYNKTSELQKYCTRNCAKSASALRGGKKIGEVEFWRKANAYAGKIVKVQYCPTPHKQAYYNEEHAAMFVVGQRLYECPCGAYHLSTKRTLEEKKKSAAA